MDAFTAQQTTELVSRIGCKKSTMRLDKLFVNSLLTGPLLGFGCAVLLGTNTAASLQTTMPGLIRTIGALLFPVGLVMIVLTGSDLFTSNIMFMTTAFLHRRISLVDLLKNWTVSFFGNLAGMLFFMAIVTGYGGVFEEESYKTEVFKFATKKVVEPGWHQIMLRAIGANWLVCLAVFLSISGRDLVSKITAIWWPCATFVALALDHVIANMYFIPIAIFLGHPNIDTSYYIWKSLIPTTIGNVIGGAIFVALPYWYLYLTGEAAVELEFNTNGIDSAVGGQGGPTRSRKQKDILIHGREPNTEDPSSHLPSSGGHMTSAVSRELSGEKYGKSKAERDAEKSGDSSETV